MNRRTGWKENFLNLSEWNLNPYQILTLGFAAAILVGSILLMLPAASREGTSLSFIDALFTATSAVCVTGLCVVDTGNYFSVFGQLVIISLIQIGGLGVMTITTLLAVIMGRRIQLRNRLLVQESLNQLTMEGMVRLVLYVVKVTFLIEFIGGTILALRFAAEYGWRGVYYGYWHAVSGFCNAGFDVFGGTTFFKYASDPIVTLTISGLIVLGGIGFAVMNDVWEHRAWRSLAVQTKVVLSATGILLFAGALVIFLLEHNNGGTLASLGLSGQILASIFESVTARTAGFAVFDNGALGEPALLVVILLMFIGASPASTGGGIKTSTCAIIVSTIWSLIRGKKEVELFSRGVPMETIMRALMLFFIAATIVFSATMYLCMAENMSAVKVAFEVVSALATVGLSTGITPSLTADGKFVLILLMLMGRVGIVTFAMALAMKKDTRQYYHHPMGKFTVG